MQRMITLPAVRICVALLIVAAVLNTAGAFPAPVQAQPRTPQARVGAVRLTSVADWESGGVQNLLVTNNSGGELRLAEGATIGSFVSPALKTTFPLNAVGAIWRAEIPAGTQVQLEVRGRTTPPEGDPESGWEPWQPLFAAETRSAARGSEDSYATPIVLPLPANTQYLQMRAILGSQVARASPILEEVTLAYLNTTAPTPVFAAGLPRRPILFGPPTLTPRPAVISRADWSGNATSGLPLRGVPQGIVIHQIDASLTPTSTLEFVRALEVYQTAALGWGDLHYHYLIDSEGNLFEGRLGGPTALTPHLAGGIPAVHVALIAPRDAPVTSAAVGVLINLLAWLGQAYEISPTGEHRIDSGSTSAMRPNIAGHNDVVSTALDPFPPLRSQLPQIRALADESTVRARWYFAEGNVAEYSQRIALFNPTATQADARVILVLPGQTPITRIVDVPANGRADLTVNDLVQGIPALSAVVESSAPILAERTMSLTTDIDGSPGITSLSRVWYFAEGSTEGNAQTYIILFNPNPTPTQATVRYLRRDGITFEQPVTVGAQSRLVIAVHDITLPDGSRPLLGTSFGAQIIAGQPIAAERTLRFGPDRSGFHTARGIVTLSRRWHFAEGTTEGDFRMRLLVLNPNTQPARVTATFLTADGRAEARRYAVPPRAQLRIDVNEIVPDAGVSALVEADRPIAVERALIFNRGAAGTITAGATDLHFRWAFVDGRTSDATYFLCVGNPGSLPARVTVDFSFAGGDTGRHTFDVPARSRYTLAVHTLYPDENVVAAVVRSTQPVVAERSVFPGGGERGGVTTLGIPLDR